MSTDDQSKPVWKELLSKRSSTKGQITKFKNYLERLSGLPKLSDLEIIELNLKIMKFEGLSAKFDDLQTEIEIQNSHNLQTETEERDRIETDIIQCMAIAKILIKSNEAADDAERRRSSCHFSGSDFQDLGFKLPQIQVSKFDGSYFRWLEFRDTFLNLIHNNERIPDIHKFHYLCSYLEGNAARIISNLEVSSDNYKEAWTLLCERYDNKRILINHHLDSLINIQPVTRESENSLRFLVDHMTKNLRALASLGQPTQHWDALVIFIMSSKLDSRTTTKWEECRNTLYTDVPTLDQFKQFLIDRADVLETLNRNKGVYTNNNTTYNPSKSQSVSRYSNNSNSSSSQNNNNNFNKRNQTQYTKSFASINNNQSSSTTYLCVICNGNHKIYDCATFKSKGLKERLNYVSKYKLCANCLRQGHPISEFRMGPCRQCNQRHNSLLHNPNVSVTCTIECDQNPSSLVSFSKQNSAQVLLSTATIEVCNPVNNKREQVRALLDCGSQSSFVTKSLQQKLSLKTNPLQAINVIGIGNNCTNQVVEGCVAELKSINSSFHVTLSCYVLDELTGNLPKVSINKQNLPIPNCITLADPKFDQPAPIDVLIGADLFWDILESEQRSLGPNNPKLQKSKFGWIVAGPMSQANPNNKIHCNHAVISNPIIDEMLPKFWELEELPQKKILSPNETACEKHSLMNTTRLNTGRFSVKLPLKDFPDCLGDSYYLAKKRLLNLEKRFRQNLELKAQYVEFISEYEELGHLSESSVLVANSSYFLCHHAVLKEESETTKLRVVFDGSAATTSGFSLNDVLLVGPNMQDSLFSILIRARQYQYILTGDIAKMYRQVEVSEEDRNLQLILWRENESQPIKTLRLGTVTYGTASASYLSTRCLWQVGEECPVELIKNIIQNDFYVDDLITGCDSESKLQYIQNSISKALISGCFQLRKYKTNSKILFQNEDQNTTLNNKEKLIFSESSSTLGLGWDPSSDQLHFPVKKIDVKNDKITKRHILSNSFRIFDPLGLLSPFIIQPKMLLQKLWQAGLEWDEPVSQDVRDEWFKIANDLPIIADLAIPRKVLCESPSTVELHSFSDASQRAYGACIYLKSIQGDRVTVRLLCSKSKVVPLKPTTIPRLELCAALLAAKLCKSVLDSIRYTSKRVVHWCDSSVVIGWLNSTPSKLKTFVANRVGEILELTNPKSWNYVPTDANPADLISRGVSANLLRDSTLWWSGPAYLQKDESEWPKLKSKQLPTLLELPESLTKTVV